jgi:membrane-bound lytic murein transglycosylase F
MPQNSHYIKWKLILASLLILAILTACSSQKKNKLQSVKSSGELVVLTKNSPTTFYKGPNGYEGIEYDLATAFADHLGVAAVFQTMDDEQDLAALEPDEVDLIAAGLSIDTKKYPYLRYTTHYQVVAHSVIYRAGTFPPKSVKYLHQHHIDVVAGAACIEQLKQLKKANPKISWTEVENKSDEEILQMVTEGLLELTVVDSNIYNLNRPFYPDLRIAFNLGKSEKLAWALPKIQDESLYKAANKFIKKMHRNGELARLLDHYYGVTGVSNPVNMSVYHLRIQNRLPKYQTMFETAGTATGIDWRLLAAMGYQESFWNPKAKSPTGVEGLMMLTKGTARSLGVTNRTDPKQAIDGGARYIKEILDRLPASIKEPDRLWMALAAYNVGEGHLEDARIITQKRKANPDIWSDVKKSLPLLSRRKWYSKTKYGYARGIEPARFVTRIRNYYDVLVRKDEEEQSSQQTDAIKLKAPSI